MKHLTLVGRGEHGPPRSDGRVFLFLQGPHGPFFGRLARALDAEGARCLKIAFNRADRAEWPRRRGRLDYAGNDDGFSDWLNEAARSHGVTDLVLYGDVRPRHAAAIRLARDLGLRAHCFEEGYLRPHWITYERAGTNGFSPACRLSVQQMRTALASVPADGSDIPEANWGDWRQHLWWSFLYHLRLLPPTTGGRGSASHRALSVRREAAHYIARTAKLPALRLRSAARAASLLRGRAPFHLVLLQLSFDSSVQAHSHYTSNGAFVSDCIAAFASGARPGHLLVFKTHPFEDGRERLEREIRRAARQHGVAGRVVLLDGGRKLSALLDHAVSVVTINSTAAQQALWRGLPVRATGRAVYRKPELTSEQPLSGFFAAPHQPSAEAYETLRRFLLATSQVRGSFYSRAGIERLMASLPALMLDGRDAYDRLDLFHGKDGAWSASENDSRKFA